MKAGVALVLSDLNMGGSQRVLSRLAEAFAAEGTPVRIVTLASGTKPPFYPLPPGVRVSALGVSGNSSGIVSALKNNILRLFALRRALRAERPATVISFGHKTNVRVLLACLGLGLPVIVSERSNPFSNPLEGTWNFLRRLAYPRARTVVVLNDRCAAYFRPWLGDRVRVIPNAVDAPAAEVVPAAREKEIVGLGRLVPLKGFDLLIRAFHRIREEIPEWKLVIRGEGEARAELEREIRELGLEGRVSLGGATAESRTILRRASIFALPSRFEGFPNALCEAMAEGLAVVAADCETGPRELVADGVNGLLVPPEDIAALARALLALAKDPALRARLALRAGEIVELYSPSRVFAQWTGLVEEASRPVKA